MSSDVVGFVAAAVAVVCFGSNFLPVKGVPSGDGIYYQWIMCLGVWIFGFFVMVITSAHEQFYPLAVVGGVSWCLGNALAVPAIQCIGLGLGMCIWGTTNMLVGWASGRFGFFGLINEQQVHNPTLNYVGVGLAVVSVVAFMFVKPDMEANAKTTSEAYPVNGDDTDAGYPDAVVTPAVRGEPEVGARKGIAAWLGRSRQDAEGRPLLVGGVGNTSDSDYSISDRGDYITAGVAPAAGAEDEADQRSVFERVPPVPRRIFGVVFSVISGLLYGVNFNPPQIIMDRKCTGVAHLTHPHVPSPANAVGAAVFGTEASVVSHQCVKVGTDGLNYKGPGNTTTSAGPHYAATYDGCCDGVSSDSLDYVFSHFCGIMITSTFIFVVYALAKRNQPWTSSKLTLPAFISGVVWAMAQTSWFIANGRLGLPIAFPIIATGPGLVAQLWGVFVYREVTNRRSLLVLVVAFVFLVSSALCVGFSNMHAIQTDVVGCPPHDVCCSLPGGRLRTMSVDACVHAWKEIPTPTAWPLHSEAY
eukprot:TRINITY_DN47210_c0_g1_i1.p1 TRINITY_DN47210_c0_g1~~TRINITY_DN47210_c0_g1_i1.p1  ORF type:complete len:529 (+),score=93.48 TRINITY_DN47210_c0_g1_i1:86-1672(+)